VLLLLLVVVVVVGLSAPLLVVLVDPLNMDVPDTQHTPLHFCPTFLAKQKNAIAGPANWCCQRYDWCCICLKV
jgi:hypothetical protein